MQIQITAMVSIVSAPYEPYQWWNLLLCLCDKKMHIHVHKHAKQSMHKFSFGYETEKKTINFTSAENSRAVLKGTMCYTLAMKYEYSSKYVWQKKIQRIMHIMCNIFLSFFARALSLFLACSRQIGVSQPMHQPQQNSTYCHFFATDSCILLITFTFLRLSPRQEKRRRT